MNSTTLNLTASCPEPQSEETLAFLNAAAFWIEKVLCFSIALPGFVGNIGSSYILSTKGKY